MDSTPESTVEITEVMTDELAAQQPGARMGGSNGVMHWTLHQLHHEIMQIPQSTLHSLKMELGYGDRDISNLDYAEKVYSIVIFFGSKFHNYCCSCRSRCTNDRHFIAFVPRGSDHADRPRVIGSFRDIYFRLLPSPLRATLAHSTS